MSDDALARLNSALDGRYRIAREIGEGGMATVYLADDLKHDRKVALKVLKPELAAVVGAERFLAEIKTTANLQHPHILPLFDSGEADGLLFYVMPFVEGESLRDRLDRERQLPVEEAVQIAVDVAEALAHAHAHGVVHRDVKPENVMLMGGRAVLADFGVAKAVGGSDDVRLTKTGLALGTPVYMSPEQATGGSVDARSDQYALACMLFEMLGGDPPFMSTSPRGLMARKLEGRVPSLSVIRETVSAALEAAVQRALAIDAADRFDSVEAFISAVQEGSLDRSGRRGSAARPWWGSRSGVLTGVLATAIIAASVGWWGAGERESPGIQRVAVLPPMSLGVDAERDPLVQGMYVALVTELGQAGVRLIGGLQSMMRYRDTEMTIPEIAAELGVDAVIEPSVFWVGDSVGIGVRLVDGRTEDTRWSRTYDADARDVLGLYRRVTREVAEEIQVAVSPAGAARLARVDGVDPEAHEAYLRGRFYGDRMSPAELQTAIDYFERALAIDSTYADAHAGIAWVWTVRSQMALAPFAEATRQATLSADRALALDSLSAEVRQAIAYSRGWALQDWEVAEREFRRAIELNPSSGDLHANISHVLLVLGRAQAAEAHADTALMLDPFNGRFTAFRAAIYANTGRTETALADFEQLLSREPGSVFYRNALMLVRHDAGQWSAVVELMADLLSANGMAEWADSLREDFEARGYAPAMRALGDRYAALAEQGLAPARAPRIAYTLARDVEGTLTWLERQLAQGDPDIPYIAPSRDRMFAFVRDEPRFQALLRELDLEWALGEG